MASEMLQAVIDGTPADFADPADDYKAVRVKFEPFHGAPVQDGTRIEDATTGDVSGSWVRRADPAPRGTALFCHGGAFVSCDGEAYLFYAEIAAMQLGLEVLLVDYRLAPEHPFPAALDDCAAAYAGLIEWGIDPSTIVLVGDSCGGGLALATLFRARDAGLAMPAGLIGLSAWLDLDTSGYAPEFAGRPDPFQDPDWYRVRVRDYVGPAGDLHDPYASPAHGDPSGLPPLLLQVGEVDLHRQDNERFAQRARASGVDVTVDVADGAVHGFQGLVGMGLPEAVASWQRANSFVDRCLSTRPA